jgi:hypothetical protein
MKWLPVFFLIVTELLILFLVVWRLSWAGASQETQGIDERIILKLIMKTQDGCEDVDCVH